MIYGELGRFPIEIDIKIRMVSFWARLLLGKETKLSYLSYKRLYTLSIEENVHFVWIKYLKELFDKTDYSSIWINQDIPNSNWLISSIKLRLLFGLSRKFVTMNLFLKFEKCSHSIM
jgi:hypothetical protein